ncbi:MAG: TonB family protein [Alphaproteobacteria bacterium]
MQLSEDGFALVASGLIHAAILSVLIFLPDWLGESALTGIDAEAGAVIAIVTLAEDPSSARQPEAQPSSLTGVEVVPVPAQPVLPPVAHQAMAKEDREANPSSGSAPLSVVKAKPKAVKPKVVDKTPPPSALTPTQQDKDSDTAKTETVNQSFLNEAVASTTIGSEALYSQTGAEPSGQIVRSSATASGAVASSAMMDSTIDVDNHGPPVITTAKFRNTPRPPAYPSRALELKQEGTSIVRALIDVDGSSREVKLWQSSGFDSLDRAAVAAVRNWDFEAAHVGSQAILAWVEIPVRFNIK